MSLTICPAYDRPEEVKALFLEYTDFLLKSDPSFAAFLELQNYDRELDHLEEKYGLPKADCIWRWWMTPLPAALPCIPSRIRNVS